MKKTSKILAIILAILMIISIIPLTASAETKSGTCGENVTWTYDDTTYTLTISGTGQMERNGYGLLFASLTPKVQKVIIGDGVTSICKSAFQQCIYLTDVSISNTVTVIDNSAFYCCPELTNITLPNSLTSIGNSAFGLCDGLTSIVLPDSVTTIGDYAFRNCQNIKRITIPDSVTSIGEGAFTGCFRLEAVKIPDGITTIKANTFDGCTRLLSIIIPKSVTTIESYAFHDCHLLLDVYYLGTQEEWESISIGQSDTSNKYLLNTTIHYHTHNYSSVVTAPTCTEQGFTTYTCVCGDSYVVDYVNALGHTDNNNGFCDICNKYLITSGDCGYNLIWTFDESTGTLTISGTGEMYNDEHQYCMSWDPHIDSIESVIISESVTTIGKSAFDYHKNIKNVSIADSVTEIGERAFYNCTGLTEVVIGKGVTVIGDFAFEKCSNLESVTIYNAVEEICRYAFNGCSKLTDVYYWGTEAEWNAITKATLLSKTGLENATIHFLGEETHECSYNAVVTPPTCTEQGYTTYTCECGDSYVDDYADATGHNYNAVVTAPTCTEEGYTTHTCTACGRKYKDDYTPNNGHKYNMAESKVKEATCTEGGYRYVQCLNCDFIFYYNIIDATGHWYEDETVILPTCTETGYISGVCKCGDTFEEIVDALGHTEEKIPAVAPTCTETGLTSGTKCSVCGETIKEQETVPAKGHKYTPVTTIPATHTTTGIMTYICNCGDRYTKVIEKLDAHHNYKSVITAPTCTEQGYTTYTCSCGDTYIRDYVDATGHNYNAVVTAPTCTEQGYTTYTCSCGDTYIRDSVEATGHNHESVITAPTCTEQGYTTYTCECGDTYVADYVEANGHTPANAVEENYIAPTCTEQGSKDIVVYCSVCDEEISRETETLEATGHADNDGDGYCDADNELLDPSVECECNCHKTGISKFFFNLILFFQKIFGSNNVCDCGVAHY